MRTWTAVFVLCFGCTAATGGDPEWVAPVDTDTVPRGDAIELAVASTDAAIVRFAVDGTEVGVCDPAQADEDCQRDDVWRWTVVFPDGGAHEVTATVVGVDGDERLLTRTITAVEPAAYTASTADLDTFEATRDAALDPEVGVLEAAGRGHLDPSRAYHSIYGGIAWRVTNQRVVLHTGTPTSSVSAVRACMNRYGASIRRWADHYGLSRASVVATALTESSCTNPAGSSDGLSSGPMQVTASTCSALTGLSRATCRSRMHTSPDFSFQVGTKYMASSYQVGQHRHDPPKIAAAYNAGSLRRSSANRWHLLTTGNHIDRFVSAYNAYRSWELP